MRNLRIRTLAAGLLLVLFGAACDPDRTDTLLPHLELPPARFDFGAAPLLNERRLELPLDNPGRGALSVISIHVKDAAGPFRVGEFPPEVARGSRAVVSLYFRPLEERDFEGTLVVETDDPTHPVLELPMTGTGHTRAVMEVDPPSLVFGRTPEGGATVQTFTIRSLGTADLLVEGLEFTEETGPGFAFIGSTRTPAVVETRGEDGLPGVLRLTVKYAPPPGAPQEARGGVRIRNTDPDQPAFILPLEGQVNRAPIAVIADVGPAAPGMTVTLDGSGSLDPDHDTPLTWAWRLVSKPPGATATLGDPTLAVTGLTLDPILPGEYEVALDVFDGLGAKSLESARLRIVAVPAQQLLVELFWNHTRTDVDLHLLASPEATLFTSNDCHYANCVPSRGVLDWGVVGVVEDDPVLLRDALVGYGPEVIGIKTPTAGTYRVVAYFQNANHSPEPASEITVRVYSYGVVVHESKRTLAAKDERWDVVDVAWPAGTATVVAP